MELLSSIILIVLYVVITAEGKSITVRYERNNKAVLPCRTQYILPNNIKVQWFRGGSILSSGLHPMYSYRDRLRIVQPAPTEWNLEIERVDESYTGTYTCKTSNEEVLLDVNLIIETEPRFDELISTAGHIVFDEFSNAKLVCQVSGEPPPEITWYRGTEYKEIGIKGDNLIIPRIERYAADEYICVARNKHGEAERRITVDVQFGPVISVMNPTIHFGTSEEVVMACKVEGYPIQDAYWVDNKGINATKFPWKYEVMEEEEKDSFPVRFIRFTIKPNVASYHTQGMYTCHAVCGQNRKDSAVVNLIYKRQGYQITG